MCDALFVGLNAIIVMDMVVELWYQLQHPTMIKLLGTFIAADCASTNILVRLERKPVVR